MGSAAFNGASSSSSSCRHFRGVCGCVCVMQMKLIPNSQESNSLLRAGRDTLPTVVGRTPRNRASSVLSQPPHPSRCRKGMPCLVAACVRCKYTYIPPVRVSPGATERGNRATGLAGTGFDNRYHSSLSKLFGQTHSNPIIISSHLHSLSRCHSSLP